MDNQNDQIENNPTSNLPGGNNQNHSHQKLFWVGGTVILVILVAISGVFCFSSLRKSSLKRVVQNNIPKSYEECVEQKSVFNNMVWFNNLVCYYGFVIQDNDSLRNYCEKNGRILPPDPRESPRCRLSYYNPKAKVPRNYDECVELMGPSYVYEMVGSRAGTRFCQFELGGYKTMTPEIKNKLAEQSRKLYNSCFKRFYK